MQKRYSPKTKLFGGKPAFGLQDAGFAPFLQEKEAHGNFVLTIPRGHATIAIEILKKGGSQYVAVHEWYGGKENG